MFFFCKAVCDFCHLKHHGKLSSFIDEAKPMFVLWDKCIGVFSQAGGPL